MLQDAKMPSLKDKFAVKVEVVEEKVKKVVKKSKKK